MLKFTRIIQNTKGAINFLNVSRILYSTASIVELKNADSENGKVSNTTAVNKQTGDVPFRNSMVAAAFASLQKESVNGIETPQTDNRISSANTVQELLSISEGSSVSRKHALKVLCNFMRSGNTI